MIVGMLACISGFETTELEELDRPEYPESYPEPFVTVESKLSLKKKQQ
jgi:hypothetical protein